jgi:hypothetical protein
MPLISRLQIKQRTHGRADSTIIQTKDIAFQRENN